MAGVGGCRYLAKMMTVALVCFAFPTASSTAAVKMGAWGYNIFPTFDHSGYDGIESINIGYGEIIDGIQFTYVKKGKTMQTPPIGVVGTKEIKLDYPDEYLIHISGSVGSTPYARSAIKGLKFYTNKKTYGPFGWRGGNWRTFDSFVCGKKIVGFYGDAISPRFLASIGVYLDNI